MLFKIRGNLGCEEQKPPSMLLMARRDPRWAKHWVVNGIMGGKNPQPNVYRCLCMKTHTHLSSDILHTHTQKENEHFETEGIKNTWGLTANTNKFINHSESFIVFFHEIPQLYLPFVYHVMSIQFQPKEQRVWGMFSRRHTGRPHTNNEFASENRPLTH